MKLLPKQENAVFYLKDGLTKELVFGGAAGGGKSALGALWLIEMCLKFPGSRWLMGRSKLKALKETTLNTFFDLTSDLGLSDQYTFNSQSNIVYWNNGSEILLKDLYHYPADPKFDSLGSLEITGAFVDECNQVVLLAWQIVTSRCRYRLTEWDVHGERTDTMEIIGRDKHGVANLWRNSKGEETPGLIPKSLGTCNPAKNWTYKEFYKPDRDGALKPQRKFIQSLPTDNPYLPKSYLETLLSLDKASVQRLYYGNWEFDNDPATLIDADSISDYWGAPHVKAEGEMFMTIDVARKGKDTTVYRVWKGWKVIYRLSIAKSDLVEVVRRAEKIQVDYEIPLSHVIADEDGVGCLSEEMEVMTDNGWVQAKQITKKTKILSKNKAGNKHYIKPHTIIHHKEEKFIEVNNSLTFTASHSHYYRTRPEHQLKLDFWERITKKGRIYHDSHILNDSKDVPIIFKKTKYKMPNGGMRFAGKDLKISQRIFCKFLGWYLSEGYTDGWNNKYVVGITQTSKSKHCTEIEEVLTQMGVNWYKKKQKKGSLYQYQFQHKGLFNWLRANCYTSDTYTCYFKKLPKYIKQSTTENILEFCESFINGDGYYHKGQRTFSSTSKLMLDDIQEVLFYCGINSRIHISAKKGSTSTIEGRVITRTVNGYVLSEVNHPSTERIKQTREYYGKAINIKIDNETKCLLVRNNNKIFWTHNGGVVDFLKCKGFVNGSKPLKELIGEEYVTPNYNNLKTQCSYKMAEKIVKREVGEVDNDSVVKERTSEEMEQIKQKDIDKDGKIQLVGKDIIKSMIGRSPDEWDSIMMRYWFELTPKAFTF